MITRHRLNLLRDLAVGGTAAVVTLLASPVLRRWYNRWGATDEEIDRSLPGDELVRRPELGYTRAITIDASPERVWPWLAQIGQGRGGFYSYDGLENLVGCGIHSVDELLPDHQEIAVGDIVRSGRDRHVCWIVMDVEAPHHLILQGAGTPVSIEVPEIVDDVPPRGYVASTWQWVLGPVDGGVRTRLVVRQRCTYSPRQWLLWRIVEPLNFVMERRMLLGMRDRAEAASGSRPGS